MARCVLECLEICYRKKGFLLSVRRVMRNLVIHSDHFWYPFPGVDSWVLHHGNAPAYTTLLVGICFNKSNTILARPVPILLNEIDSQVELEKYFYIIQFLLRCCLFQMIEIEISNRKAMQANIKPIKSK